MLEEAIFGLLVPKLQGSLESKKIRERILGCSMTAGSRPLHHEQNSKLRGGAAEKLHLQTKKEKKTYKASLANFLCYPVYKIWWPEAVCYKRNSHTYFTFWKINIKDPAKQLWSGSDRCREESGEDGMEDRQGVEE